MSWGKHHLLGPAGRVHPNAAQKALGCLCHECTLLAHFQLVAQLDPVPIMFGGVFQDDLVYLQTEGKGLK